jgi:hypothetical protein
MAECVREGVALYLAKSDRRVAGIDSLAGKYRPIAPDGLKAHDRYWAEAARSARKAPDVTEK